MNSLRVGLLHIADKRMLNRGMDGLSDSCFTGGVAAHG